MSDRFTGLWVAVEAGVGRDPKVQQLAAALGIKLPMAVGHLAMLWGGVAEHAPDGNVSQVLDETLEFWASWGGKRGAFSAVYRRLFVSEAGEIRAWGDHNGRWLAKSLKERARKRRGRSADSPADVRGAGRGQSAINPTQPNQAAKAASAEVGGSAESVVDLPAVVEITKALNDGMSENPAIGSRLNPVAASAGTGIVGEWLEAGFPLPLIRATVHRLGREYKPKPTSPQIGSLAYCDKAVREAMTTQDDARYAFLAGEAQRGMDMSDTAKYPDWPLYRDRYWQGEKAKGSRGTLRSAS